jgi:hypothetical protein
MSSEKIRVLDPNKWKYKYTKHADPSASVKQYWALTMVYESLTKFPYF